MIKTLWILILLNLAISCGHGFDKEKLPRPFSGQESQEVDSYSVNLEYLELVNEFRISIKLRPLEHHSILEDISYSHSKSMGLHTRPFGNAGNRLRCRRLKNRLGRIKQCLELVAMGQKDVKGIFDFWINTPKHREILEQPNLTHTGLGFYKDVSGVIYWTQMFVEL
jgi:uncharacterized protein YkwD